MPQSLAQPVVGYKKRVEQLRIQVDALRRVEAEEGDVDAVSRQELAHELVEQQRSVVNAGLRKVQAWRVEAAVAAAIPLFAQADALESLDLDVEARNAAVAKPAPPPAPAPAGYASRRPHPAPLIPSAGQRKHMAALNGGCNSGGGSGIIVPGPAARVLMCSVSTVADDDAVDIAPPPRLQPAVSSMSMQQQQQQQQQHQHQHQNQHQQQQHQQHQHQQQQQVGVYALPPVNPRHFRAPSPLLEVEEEDLLSPMFDSLDLDVKARQVLLRLHRSFFLGTLPRCTTSTLRSLDCSQPTRLQFVDIATGEKASKGFDHRSSVSMCGGTLNEARSLMRSMTLALQAHA
jgi:type II secretory pathway pseudopilin PulG